MAYDSGAGTSPVAMNENLEERLGQALQERRGGIFPDRGVTLPTSMRADLDEYALVTVTDPNGIVLGDITRKHSSLTIAKFGEMFLGCAGSEECKKKLLSWLQKKTRSKAKVFTIMVPDQKSFSSCGGYKFDFTNSEKLVTNLPLRNSGFLEKGEYVIVRNTFIPSEGMTIAR